MNITQKEYEQDKLFWWRNIELLPFRPLCWLLFHHEIGDKSFCLNCGAKLKKQKQNDEIKRGN
jgi:hypothetical protein